MSNVSPIDMEHLSLITDGDSEVESQLFETFLSNARRCLSNLQNALDGGSNDEWYGAAHELKGSSGSIGAFSLSELLAQAQGNSKEGSEYKGKLLDEIRKEFSAVESFIKGRG